MVILILVIMGIALVWTIYDKLFGKPKPSVEEYRSRLEKEEWYRDLKADPDHTALLESHRGIRSFLNSIDELQRLLTNENARKGFIKYVRQESKKMKKSD